MTDRSKSIYFVLGEVSGDALADDVLEGFAKLEQDVTALGLAGPKLQARGVSSLFPISDISVMGVTAVARKLPIIMSRVRQTVRDIVARKPDVVLLIDSPEFGYAVAKRVRKRAPDIKIIKYICPSVWAWRPARARKMKPFIDHVMTILPFEPQVLQDLGGPSATYIGHPLGRLVREEKRDKPRKPGAPVKLAILPGSRQGEVNKMLPVMRQTLELLKERGFEFEIRLPAVEHLHDQIKDEISEWSLPVEIAKGEDARAEIFRWADVALATSGTVTLELALYGVPFVPIYKLDRVMMQMRHLFTGWTTSLPNLIADEAFVQECMNEFCTPGYVARVLEGLMVEGPRRDVQLQGFKKMAANMAQDEPAGLKAARTILAVSGS